MIEVEVFHVRLIFSDDVEPHVVDALARAGDAVEAVATAAPRLAVARVIQADAHLCLDAMPEPENLIVVDAEELLCCEPLDG